MGAPQQQAITTPEAIRLALEHHRAGRLPEAEAIYRRILDVEPGNFDALHLLGTIACQVGRYGLSVELIEKALAIKADFAEAWSNRGGALEALRRYGDAIASYDKALAIRPGFAEALYNRGNALLALERCDEAVASYDGAIAVRPDYAEALSNRGNALRDLKRYDEALASYARALAIKPDYAIAHWNESLCRLRTGDFERGLEEYEWRSRCEELRPPKREFAQPRWLGEEEVAGKTILLHAEQGLGDTIHFCRYAQPLERKGAKVILEVQPALKSLLSGVAGAHAVLAQGEALPQFDLHCPLLSLPLAFKTRLESIPAAIPYVSIAPAMTEKWQRRLPQKSALRIGIAWSGNRDNTRDSARSIALKKLARIAGPGVTLVSLHNSLRSEDEPDLAANGHILHFGSELDDFSDNAALASLMDLVISVDTSIAHLAGALGKPVWVLLAFAADWRWLTDREDSPWYPTAKLYRQNAIGDWDGVMERVERDLVSRFIRS